MSVDESLFGMPAEKGRWGLIILGMIINLCLGTIYSWSVFVGPLTTYFSTTLSQTVTANEILMPFSVFLAFFAIAMPLTGKYIETLGPRKVTIIGGILTGLGWLLASTVTSVWMLYIVYGVIGGIGVGIAYGVPVAVAARWFPDRRGTAVGLTLLGFGFSAFLTANIAGYFINTDRGDEYIPYLWGCIYYPDCTARPPPPVPSCGLEAGWVDTPGPEARRGDLRV